MNSIFAVLGILLNGWNAFTANSEVELYVFSKLPLGLFLPLFHGGEALDIKSALSTQIVNTHTHTHTLVHAHTHIKKRKYKVHSQT